MHAKDMDMIQNTRITRGLAVQACPSYSIKKILGGTKMNLVVVMKNPRLIEQED
jgi:hypothetical protein